MALNRRQTKLYTFRFSLYNPSPVKPPATVPPADPSTLDLEMDDAGLIPNAHGSAALGTEYRPLFTNVPGFYKGTPEFDQRQTEGRMPELNLFTADEFHFDAAQPLADTWLIKMTASDPRRPPHPYIGRVWAVQDNPQVVAAQGRRDANYQMAYALLQNIPGLSTPVTGIS